MNGNIFKLQQENHAIKWIRFHSILLSRALGATVRELTVAPFPEVPQWLTQSYVNAKT